MNQEQKRNFLIKSLLMEKSLCTKIEIPKTTLEQKRLLRSLLNIRQPKKATEEFLSIQNEYLQERILEKGITDLDNLTPNAEGLYLWKGDITTLKCDAIVNAANSQMLGCFCPCHGCIDNAIHTFSGIQLRLACNDLMKQQKFNEPTGMAKITPAFNLPSKYVIHTVGPIVHGKLTEQDLEMLASCYHSCLSLAEKNKIKSIAFCCISTGEFNFPNDRAAEIAVQTVRKYKLNTYSKIKVIFNVFKDVDYKIYQKLLR